MRSEGRGVESTCGVLEAQGVRVAPRSSRAWRRGPAATRTITDASLVATIRHLQERDVNFRQ